MARRHKGDNGFSQANNKIHYPRSTYDEYCTIKDDKTNRKKRSQGCPREYEGNESKHEDYRDGHGRVIRKRHIEHSGGNAKRRRTESPSSRQHHDDRNHVGPGIWTEARSPRRKFERRLRKTAHTFSDRRIVESTRSVYSQREDQSNKSPWQTESETFGISRKYEDASAQRLPSLRKERIGQKRPHKESRSEYTKRSRKRSSRRTSIKNSDSEKDTANRFVGQKRDHSFWLKDCLSLNKEGIMTKLQELLEKDSSDVVIILLSEKSTFKKLLSTAPRTNICVYLKIVRILIHSFDCESANSMICSVIGEIKDTKYLEKLTSVVQDRINEEMMPCLDLLEIIIECINRICNMNPSDRIYILGICKYVKDGVQQISEKKLADVDMSKIKTLISIVEDIQSQCMKPNKSVSNIDRQEETYPTFRELSIYPTTADIHAEMDPHLRPIKAKGGYANLDHYLDNHFRLLREDFIIPLRDGIKGFINGNVGRNKKKFINIRVYENARILHPVCCESGINYLIAFDVSKLKHVRWTIGKRLKYGSILCLSSDRFSTCFYAIVDDSNYKDRAIGLVTVKFVEDIPAFSSLSGKLFQFTESTVYFESVCHVLTCLQRINELPFMDYLIKCKKDVLPPKYLRDSSDRTVDLKPILKMTMDRSSEMEDFPDINPANFNLLEDPWPDASHLCLNETQSKAVMSALTREFCVIQGPPGCGKTYVGLKIVEMLMYNKWLWTDFRSSPILLLCYTNHALDQFMEGVLNFSKEGVLNFSKGILRIGERSRSDVLKPYNLKTIRKRNRINKTRPFHLFKMSKVAREEKKALVDKNPSSLFKALRQNILNEKCLRQEMGEQIYNQFKILEQLQQRKQYNHKNLFLGKSVMVEWLGIHNMFEDICSKANAEDSELDTEMTVYNKDSDSSEVYEHKLSKEYVALDLDKIFDQIKSKDEKIIVQKLVNKIRRRLLCSNDEIFAQKTIFTQNLSVDKRWQFYRSWVNSFCDKKMPRLVRFSRKYNNACQICEEERRLEDKSIMQNASLIGMTTSCGAKYQAVLNEIKPKIIIVEEAAEIVESHIVANLTINCEQLIMIGDHKQLRPKLNVYKLEKDYNLDISLFERMVKNGIAFECLDTQHRMRPEIAEPLQFIYDRLKNHESVLHFDNIKGVGKNLFMINHNQQETNDSEISSFKNVHEAEYVAALYKYLRQQGYSHTEITVLTTYKGQLYYLKKIFSQSNENLLDSALLKTVDDYQGEENRILIISLVRSNEESRIGFLKDEKRVCVALSRAKEGLYIVGNFDNLKKSSNLWKKITEQVQINDCFGSALPLYCQNHPDTKTKAENALDFQQVPNGGCRELCNTRLPCGHSCDRYCHVDDKDHTEAKCNKRCEKRCKNNHTCKQRCHEPCFCKENVMVTFPDCHHEMAFPCGTERENQICTHKCEIYLQCGHICSKRCGEICNPCVVMIDVLSKKCGHFKRVECNRSDTKECQVACGLKLKCGHACKERCDEKIYDSGNNFNSCTKGHRSECEEMCGKSLACGHICSGKCKECLLMNARVTCAIHKKCTECDPKHENICTGRHGKHVRCRVKCRRCSHSVCSNMCGQECKPCKKPCVWRCLHYECTRKCGEICNRPICNKPCLKKMKNCDHNCPGLCGDPCPNECIQCNKTSNSTFKDRKPVIYLFDCGHTVSVEVMDRHIEKQATEVCLKTCPECSLAITTTNGCRYESYINESFIALEHATEVSKRNYDMCQLLVSQLPKANSSKYLKCILCTEMLEDEFTLANISDIIKEIHRSLDLYIFDQFNKFLNIRYMLDQFIATIRGCVDYNDTERNRTFKSIRSLCKKTNSQVDNIHFVVVEHDVPIIMCKRLHCKRVILPDYPTVDIRQSVKVHLGIESENTCKEMIQKLSDYRKTSNNENTVEGNEQTSIFCKNRNYRPNEGNDETLLEKSRTRACTGEKSINNNSDLSDILLNSNENDEIEKEKQMEPISKKTHSDGKSSDDENEITPISTIKIPFAKLNGIKECSCWPLSGSQRTRPESINNETEKQERDNKGDKLRSDKNNFFEENNFRKRKYDEERTEKFENTSNQKRQKHHSSKKETTFLDPSDLRHRLQKKRETGTVDIRLEQTKEQPTVIAESTATIKIEEDEEEDEDWIVLDEVFG